MIYYHGERWLMRRPLSCVYYAEMVVRKSRGVQKTSLGPYNMMLKSVKWSSSLVEMASEWAWVKCLNPSSHFFSLIGKVFLCFHLIFLLPHRKSLSVFPSYLWCGDKEKYCFFTTEKISLFFLFSFFLGKFFILFF